MTALETVQTATATEAAADDSQLSPTQDSPREIKVYVNLEFRGVNFDPSDLYDALNAQWGTVATDMDQPSRGCYKFVITT